MFGSLGTIWAEVGLNIKKLDEGLMAAQVKLAKAEGSINTMGQRLSNASTKLMTAGGIMAGAVTAIAVASIKMAADFEKSMRNVNSISKLSEVQFKAQSQAVIELSKKMPQSAKTLADGLYDIASSGFQGADGMKVLEAAAKAASAGLTTTATSAKGITAVLNAYGYSADEAARISDTMFRTVDKGVITFEELSSTVGDWVGMAKAANLSFEEAAGAIAYMTTKGISASEAGVSLSRMLTGIIKPSEEMAKVIKQAGFESGEMMLKTLGLTETMKVLNDTTGGSITKLIDLIPEIRGVRGANALLGAGYEELTGYMKEFQNTTGATTKALSEQSKSLSFQLEILKNNGKALGIELGSKLIPPVTEFVKKLNELSPAQKDAIYNIAELTLKFTGLTGGVLLLTGALGKLRTAMLANPIGAVIAGFATFNGVVDTGARKLEDLNNTWSTIGAVILRSVAPLTLLKEELKNMITIFSALKDGLITWKDLSDVNIFTIKEHIKRIQELREQQEKDNEATVNLANSTFNYTDALVTTTKNAEKYKINLDNVNQATEETKQSTDELVASIYNLYNLNQSVTEATWAYEDSLNNLNTVMQNANATERDKQQAIFATQDALENLQIAMIKEYEATETSIERKKELQRQYIETGIKAVNTGAMSAEAFINMAKQFGVSQKEIVKFANEMSGVLDEATRQRIIRLSLDTSAFDTSLSAAINRLNALDRRMGMYSMGGIIGRTPAYAYGGIAGMPKAATGMIVPQTGRAIPILAHEGEMILNTAQQNNLINALWGVANGRGGGSMTVNLTVISENPLSPADIARETKNALRLYGLEAALN